MYIMDAIRTRFKYTSNMSSVQGFSSVFLLAVVLVCDLGQFAELACESFFSSVRSGIVILEEVHFISNNIL